MNIVAKAHVVGSLIFGLAVSTGLGAGEIAIKPYRTGAERRLDNPVDAWMNAWPGVAGSEVKCPGNRKGDFLRYEILSDDSRNGDFSIAFTVDDPAKESAFGFSCGKYIERWEVGPKASLHLWLKLDTLGNNSPAKVVLYDQSCKSASFAIGDRPADKAWQELDLPLGKFIAQTGFDFKALRSVQVEAKLPKGAKVWLDDVYFHEGDVHIGVTDKTITQYMAETDATFTKRAEEALRTDLSKGGGREAWTAFWRGQVDEGNRLLREYLVQIMDVESCKKSGYNLYNPVSGYELPAFYFAFSSKGRFKPRSLSPEVEQLLLKAMKLNEILCNDIALTRHSTWYIIGSENHDYNKTKCLFFSQIFMHEPGYAGQVYPDPGTSLGFQCKEDVYLHWLKVYQYAVSQTGHYKDGKPYTAKDHYQGWVKYLTEYMAERARCGFFNEQGAHGAYGLAPVGNFHSIYLWAEDPTLRKQARMFLDLMYAKWLQDQTLLIQGGAATRGAPGDGSLSRVVWFYLGGHGLTDPVDVGAFGLGDYRWPRALWEMALDRKGRGEYAYASRVPNEDQDLAPRPEGTDGVMLLRRDSRLVRYSWVTPDYVMGLRMDYPSALYCHNCFSAQGITFPTSPGATILLKPGLLYRAVQDRNVALMQQKWNVNIQSPPGWLGQTETAKAAIPVEVDFGKDVDHIEEQDGWVFVQEGNAYGAFRIVSTASNAPPVGRDERGYALLPLARDNYTLEQGKGGTVLKAREPHTALIVEMSRTARHATLADFKKDVLDNPLRLLTSNPYFGAVLTYKGCGPEARELYLNLMNDEAPRIDGTYISYQSPAFASRWIKGDFDSGVVTLTGPVSGARTVLDFNQQETGK